MYPTGNDPGYEIGYDQIVSDTNITGTSAPGTTFLTCAAHWFDGAPVLAHFFSPWVQTGASLLIILLYEDTTQIATIHDTRPGSNVQIGGAVGFLRFTPTIGPHTYKLTAFVSSGTGIIGASPGARSYSPAFLRFTKV